MNDAQYDKLNKRVRRLERREGLLAGKFRETATSADDNLTVQVPDYDEGEHTFGVPEGVVWHQRTDDDGDPVYPSAGDVAYVLEASDGRWVVVAWVPA